MGGFEGSRGAVGEGVVPKGSTEDILCLNVDAEAPSLGPEGTFGGIARSRVGGWAARGSVGGSSFFVIISAGTLLVAGATLVRIGRAYGSLRGQVSLA